MGFTEEDRQKLKWMNAKIMSDTHAFIPIKPPIISPDVLGSQSTDTTPVLRQFRQDVVRSHVDKNIESFKMFGIQGIFKKTCTRYRNPLINFNLMPIKITNVHFIILKAKITGDIVNELGNRSKEGEKGTTTVRRRKSCPTAEGEYTWQKIPNSADITSRWGHRAVEDETGELLSQLSQSLPLMKPAQMLSATGHFEQGGLKSVWDLINIFVRGAITVRNGYDVTVNYTWKNQTQTQNRHIDSRIRLPVEGGVDIDWT